MGMFLNSANPYKKYRTMIRDPYFVDKTDLLESLIPALGKEQRYLCVTRPRRFGKTVMANMVAAYFGSAAQEDPLFEDLKISKSAQYRSHLHRHNVIFMDLSRVPEMCRSYVEYISRIRDGLKRDILERYGDINLCAEDALWVFRADSGCRDWLRQEDEGASMYGGGIVICGLPWYNPVIPADSGPSGRACSYGFKYYMRFGKEGMDRWRIQKRSGQVPFTFF